MHYDSKGMQCEYLKLLQCGDQQVNQLVGWTRDSPDTQVDGFTPIYTTLAAVRLAVVTIGKTFNFRIQWNTKLCQSCYVLLLLSFSKQDQQLLRRGRMLQ